jgi:hypothetical protein
MGFRFRRSARLGPLRFNFGKGGLSALHDGGDGTSFNILVRRIDYPPPRWGCRAPCLLWPCWWDSSARSACCCW